MSGVVPPRSSLDSKKSKFLDASSYGFDNSISSSEESRPLTWSHDDSDGLKDWKIEVSQVTDGTTNEESNVTYYYVHKAILAVGPNKSDYFVNLFKNNNVAEHTNSTTTLHLETTACKAFPTMLDFMYSQNGRADITPENVVAIRHLAHYFLIRKLFVQTTDYIQIQFEKDKNTYVPFYLSEATRYHDEYLLNFAMEWCAYRMCRIRPEKFKVISFHLLKEIVIRHKELVAGPSTTPSHQLSCIVAASCEAHDNEIDEEFLKVTTDEKIMAEIDPVAALRFARILSSLNCNNPDAEEWKSLRRRCNESLSKSWNDVILRSIAKDNTSESSINIKHDYFNDSSMSHRDLPSEYQIEILEAAVVQASKDMQQAKQEHEESLQAEHEMYIECRGSYKRHGVLMSGTYYLKRW